MGSVLENGLYLPDEGERNAYDGLKGNWNTLDNLVETVTALSSTGLIRKPVDALPITDIQTNVIYLLKATKPNGDVYRIEYMYIDDHWDPVGTSETTLDDYYTKTETDNLPAVKSGINATKVGNYDTHLADTDIHVTLANKQTWDGKQNALDTAQTAAVNSGITGTKVTGYDNHVSDTDIHVTAADKTAWNGKQDGLSQTQLAAVNSGITDTKVTGYDSHVADTGIHVTTADKATWSGKQDALTQTQLDNIATIPDKANSADLATVATSGSYTDLINAPTIPTVNNATLTIQKNGTDVATFTANASSNVTANLSIPVNTSDLNNDAGFLTQHNPIDNELSATSENALQNKVVKSELDGKAPLVHTHAASDVTSGTFNIARIPNLDASKITSGTIDIARLPKGSLERLIKVADQTARYALTTDDVQLGDTVQQLDTGVMYVVTDETKLDSADGYTEFTAGSASSVPWTGVTGKPSDFTPSSHTHGNITNDGKVGTTANLPLITGTGGAITAGAFGTSANTFCEGNDSRLSDARTPVAHTHTKSDVTDLLNSNFIPSANNAYDLGSSAYQWKSVYAQNYYLGTIAFGDIVTHNASEFLTSHQSLANYVTLDGDQTISGAKTFTGNVIGINKNSSTEDANDLYSTTAGSKLTYYTTTNGGTDLANVPAAVNTTLESRTIRRLSDSDWIVDQICHNSNGLYYRKGSNGTWGAWKTFAFTDSNISGNAATATQFSANKSVTLTGYINGTASSKAGWSIATALKNCYYKTGGTVTNTYFKVASGTLTGAWNRYETLIRFVELTGNASCTLRVYLQLDGSSLLEFGNVTVLNSVNFGTSSFNVVYKNDTDKTLFEIYFQLSAKNHQVNALVLYETERKSTNSCDILTMYNDSTPEAALPDGYTLLTTEFEKYCGDLVPAGNNKNLGSSTYQWNSVYGQTYFYNGTAWGLDKANNWTEGNVFTKSITFKNTDITNYKANPSSDTERWIQFWSNEWKYWGGVGHVYLTTGVSEIRIAMTNWRTNGSQGYWHLDFGVDKAFSRVYFRPSENAFCCLGDNDHKWAYCHAVNFYENGTALSSKYMEKLTTGAIPVGMVLMCRFDFYAIATGSSGSRKVEKNATVSGNYLRMGVIKEKMYSNSYFADIDIDSDLTVGGTLIYKGRTLNESEFSGVSNTNIIGPFVRIA